MTTIDVPVWRIAGRSEGYGETPPVDWYEPGRAWLITRRGEPHGVSFRCPCGADVLPGHIDVGLHGAHTLLSEDPLTVAPSMWNAYPCDPDFCDRGPACGIPGQQCPHCCHFFIQRGIVTWA